VSGRRNNNELERSGVLTNSNEYAKNPKQNGEFSSDQQELLGFDKQFDEHNSN